MSEAKVDEPPKLEKKKPPLRRGDYYYLPKADDPSKAEPLVSVTTVLQEVAKPALVSWAASQGAKAALADPNLSVKEAAGSIYHSRDSAALRGSTIHSWAEAFTLGVPFDIDALPESYQGYARAFASWMNTQQPEFVHTELTVFNRTHGYAGTLDAIARDAVGDAYILDYKTGKGVYDEAAYQLSAYMHCDWAMDPDTRELFAMPEVNYAGVIHLKSDGTYAWHMMPDRFPEFRAYLHVWRAKNDVPCPSSCWCKEV